MYGKLTDKGLVIAPNPLHFSGKKIYNPDGGIYIAAGYLPVEDKHYPDDGRYYAGRWEEQDGKIVRVWETVQMQESAPVQQREQAYNMLPIVSWGGELLTVTQAAQQWAYYAAEGDENKTCTLTALIAQAKQSIREQHPDGTE